MTKQNEMPERIGANRNGFWFHNHVPEDAYGSIPRHEYLRADTVISRKKYDEACAVIDLSIKSSISIAMKYDALLAVAKQMAVALGYAMAANLLPDRSEDVVEQALAAFEQLEKEGV